MNTNQEIAETIRTQLGGNKFAVMTGAKNFTYGERRLQFHLPRGAKNKANVVRITLEGDDTYTVVFQKYNARTLTATTISEHNMIYADMLQALFTRETGLDVTIR